MANSLATLKSQLENAISSDVIVLPKPEIVTQVDVSSFLNDLLKSQNIEIKEAKVTASTEDNSITLSGKWTAYGITQEITWAFKDEGEGKGITWTFGATTSDIGNLNDIVKHFLQEDKPIPSGVSIIDLKIRKLSISTSFNTTANQYSLQLGADSDKGAVGLAVQYVDNKWGAAAGVKLHADIKPSDILSSLTDFDILHMTDPAVIISSIDSGDFTIVDIEGVKKGITLTAALSFQENTADSMVAKVENELSRSMQDVPMRVSINLDVDAVALEAEIEKEFAFPGVEELKFSDITLGLELASTPPSAEASLDGTLKIPVDMQSDPAVNELHVKGGVFFKYADATGTVGAILSVGDDQVINAPFHFKGLTLKGIGAGLTATFGSQNSLGVVFQGKFALGAEESASGTEFALAAAITAETEGIPIPTLLSFDFENLSLPKVFGPVFEATKITLPEELNDIEFTTLAFYWAKTAQKLPDGTEVPMGIGYQAGADIWGFQAYSKLDINTDTGIDGALNISPINLMDGKIQVTGEGKAKEKYHIEAGGATIEFSTTKTEFEMSLDADILGMTQAVESKISKDGIDIKIDTDLDFFENHVAVRFHGPTDMAFSEQIKVDVDVSPTFELKGYKLGTFDLDTHLEGKIDAGFQDNTLTAKVNGSFSWMDEGFSFDYDVASYLDKMEDLAEAVGKKVLDETTEIFSDFFSHATNYLEAWGKGLLKDGDFVLNVLYHVYDYTVEKLVDFMKALDEGVHIDGTPDFDISLPGIKMPSKSFHADLGKLISHHFDEGAAFVHGDQHFDVGASHTFSTPEFEVDLPAYKASVHIDTHMPPKVHADASSPHIDAGDHLDAHFVGGELRVSGQVKVDTEVALTDIDPGAKIDVGAKAGVKIDAGWGPLHFDEGPSVSSHIDQGI